MKDINIKIGKRQGAFMSTNQLCTFAKPYDYIELTKWTNSEGYDIDIQRSKGTDLPNKERIQLTEGELECIIAVYKKIKKL